MLSSRNIVVIAFSLVVLADPVIAQDMPVPLNVQVPLLSKIVFYDRTFLERKCSNIVIGIVFQSGYRASFATKERLTSLIDKFGPSIGTLPLRYVCIDVDGDQGWSDNPDIDKVDMLYISPLRAMSLDKILQTSTRRRLLTFSGVPDYVASGVAVGFGVRDDKPLIVINLPAAKAEGADFSSQLLRVAEVIR